MKALRDEYGILANDLHRGNIMRRGDDWVVMDVGLFQTDADF
jgi:streptomycin 6-kinase